MFHQRYALAPHLRVHILDERRALLVGDPSSYLLEGRATVELLSLIDGRRNVQELMQAAASPAPEIAYALKTLAKAGHLVLTPPPKLVAADFWSGLGEDPSACGLALAERSVRVESIDGLEAQARAQAQALADAGLVLHTQASLHVVICSDLLDPALAQWNQKSLAGELSWVPVVPGGVRPLIGPLFSPGEGPCWQCLAHRLRWNRPVETYLAELRKHKESLRPDFSPQSPAAPMVYGLAALLIARQLAGKQPGPLQATLHSIEAATASVNQHAVQRRPQCPACGDPSFMRAQAQRPLRLGIEAEMQSRDGGFRIRSAYETIERIEPLISPITGVIASFGPVAERDHPLRPVYATVFRVCPRDRTPSFGDFHQPSLGKGRTPEQSKASALAEAIERLSATWHGDEHTERGRIDEIEGAIHPDMLQNFSARQYARRTQDHDPKEEVRKQVPVPFDPSIPIDWAPAHVLGSGARRYLPADYCYARRPGEVLARACRFNPNGHASGNCLEEALLQGLLELVERDSVAIWWYGRERRPGVDLDTLGGPWATDLRAHYAEMGIDLWALDLTTDLQIPAFVALARRRVDGRFCAGFGAHLDATIGLHRALSELNQLFEPRAMPEPWDHARLPDPDFLDPADLPPVVHEKTPEANLIAAIESCRARIEALGLEIIAMDLTRPDFGGMHSVKVVVPGLRHFWPRFGPGRLYEVPVRLGWRKDVRCEEELNPVPLLL